MRYTYESYKYSGATFFRIIDTLNGGKVVRRGITTDVQNLVDEMNAKQAQRSRVTLADESLKTPRDAAAAAKQLSDACFNDEIRAIVARELLRYIVRPHDSAVAVQLERAQDAASSLVNAFDRQYHD